MSANAIRVTQTLQEAGFKAFIVGGAVRDLLLGVKPKDFDVATNATPEQVKRLFRRAFIIGKRFQIVHVMFGQDLIEVTTFRGASPDEAPKDEHGRVLRDNTFGLQHEDAVRRDFTINAMYYDPATQTVLDYHGGMDDIRSRHLAHHRRAGSALPRRPGAHAARGALCRQAEFHDRPGHARRRSR